MKKLLLFLLFPVLLQAQVEYLGTVEIDTIKYEWGDTFDKLTKFIERNKIEKTKDGSPIIFIPTMKVYKRVPRKGMLVDGHLALFTYDDKTATVTLESPETHLIEYNIKTKKAKKAKKYNNDNYDSTKPKDLKDKIKKKLKEKPVLPKKKGKGK